MPYALDSICCKQYIIPTPWVVELADESDPEFAKFSAAVQDEIAALARLLQQFCPQLGRPRADTLHGARHSNMKELRFSADGGEWRLVFAFDPRRHAILPVAGDKSGVSQKRFYRELLRKAADRFDAHLARLKKLPQKPPQSPRR